MQVSIVIPAYNAERTLEQTLQSVLAQTKPDWEAIVVDDGSADSTAEIALGYARQDERIRVLQSPNGGEAAARNAGLDLARYDWVLFLDSDDWVAANHLTLLTAALEARPELDAVVGRTARVASDGTLVTEEYEPPEGDLFAILACRAAFSIHSCIVRRCLVETVGRFDTTFRKSEDWDLWQRIARTGARFGIVHEVVAYYRMSQASATSNAELMLINGLRVLKQGHGPDPRVPRPHPAHVNGVTGHTIDSQVFYLLSWCAGLMLAAGEDARGLFKSASGYRWPELSPSAVARCIFDAGIVTIRRPGSAWLNLLPEIMERVSDFLLALEEQSGTPGLSASSMHELKYMSLRSSTDWGAVIEQREQLEEERSRRIAEFEGAISALKRENQALTNSIAAGVLETEALRVEYTTLHNKWCALRAHAESEQREKAAIQRALEEQSRRILELSETGRINDRRAEDLRVHFEAEQRRSSSVQPELEDRISALQLDLRTLAEEKDSLMAQLADAAAELESSRLEGVTLRKHQHRLEQQVAALRATLRKTHQISQERALALARLRQQRWTRFGLGLGAMRESDLDSGDGEVPAATPELPDESSRENGSSWRLRVAPGNAANLIHVNDDSATLRIDILKAGTKTEWDIQLDALLTSVRAAVPYELRFRVRADRSRTIGVGLAQAQEPWSNLGFYRILGLTSEWSQVLEKVVVSSDAESARIHFDCGNHPAGVELSGLSFEPVQTDVTDRS